METEAEKVVANFEESWAKHDIGIARAFVQSVSGLKCSDETAQRVAKGYAELLSGYEEEAPGQILSQSITRLSPKDGKVYDNGKVKIKGIPFYSLCQHHVLPFWGKVTIEYLPRHTVAGLSKFPRLVKCLARRLQMQEKLGQEIAYCIFNNVDLDPLWVRVRIKARHLCMQMRGVESSGVTVTEFELGRKRGKQ